MARLTAYDFVAATLVKRNLGSIPALHSNGFQINQL
jgi:hypothetical protein